MAVDLITVGRVTMDLLAQDIGAPFEEVTGFATSVGGSPTNIAIGAARLGLAPIAFTGVGDDRVGDYVLRYLGDERVSTEHVVRVPGKHTSLALVAIQPPDRFPLTFYRDDPADIHVTVEDAAALPIDDARAILLSGNAFSRGSCADAARICGERARDAGATTYMDLDLRPTEWPDARAYGQTLRPVLGLVDVLIGTEEECHAALAPDPEPVVAGEPLSADDHATLDERLDALVGTGGVGTVVIKRGPRGATVITPAGRTDVPGFSVSAVNTVGAGDAFAAGLIRSRLLGWDWYEAARFGNACGALQVTRHGCSAVFPTEAEVTALIDEQGGV
jgi:5-dehydro-2-deoxygluconokinase